VEPDLLESRNRPQAGVTKDEGTRRAGQSLDGPLRRDLAGECRQYHVERRKEIA
jgi:hypothetical protein